MEARIASLHERMAKGGDWRAFRDEIAALHAEAKTEEEYVTLLEAHKNLVAVGKFAFDKETYAKLVPIAAAEYRLFLTREAMEDGVINPILLERITGREVEAGRLDRSDDFRKFAAAAASVLGDSAELTTHRCKHGDWFFYGMVITALLSSGLQLLSMSPLWLIVLGFVIGWFLNERERRRIKETVAKRHAASA